jgi:glycosyltransferase involved in cell wall biosynthesis
VKVLVVTHYYASHGGGIEIVADRLIRELCSRGVSVEWAASDVDAVPAAGPLFRPLPMSAFNFTERRLGFPYPIWGPGSLVRLAKAIRRADVVQLHDSLYFGNVWAFLIAKLVGRPVVVTQHIGEVPYDSWILKSLMKAANATVGRVVLRGADQAIFVADQVRRWFERRIRFRAPARLIMNGVDTTLFSAAVDIDERRELRDRLGLERNGPVFIFVGRFVEKKGLPLLRSLAQALPDVQWMFAGWGPLDPSAWTLPNVRVFLRCPPPELRNLYAAADLLVLPSVGEGFPLVVQEAMACGTPAIVANETAAAFPSDGTPILREEILGDDALSRWTARLRDLARSDSPLPALRAAAAAFARREWSWERAAQAYGECYEDLVGPRRCRSREPGNKGAVGRSV